MLNWSFALGHQSVLTGWGLCLLLCCTLFVTYRLATSRQSAGGQSAIAQNSLTPLTELVHTYACALTPWVCTLVTSRGEGFGLYTCGTLSYPSTIFSQLIIVMASASLLIFVSLPNTTLFCKRWAWEILCSTLCLQLCWTFIVGAYTLLSTLLWLEIASLCALLLLTFSSIGQLSRTPLFSSWRASHLSRQTQLGFLSAVLAFLWAGGLSTLLLLFVFCHATAGGLGLSFTELAAGAFKSVVEETRSALLWAFFATGFLIKLMLQPFQFFLLSFYRRLTFFALSMYVAFYYIFLVPSIIFIFGPALSALLPSWLILLAGILITGLGLLGGSLTSSTDLRSMLAFSTVVNLSVLLISLSAGV